ncbi:MAG: DHH family phosphoesterase [Oscillospiraceae bacterium]|jgi:phosphoesterase RecJ-like protein|nr:DHH family phosphoesterase [Oscillospiraceae bacterium]
MKQIDLAAAAARLRAAAGIVILVHQHPDGDTLGCGYALAHTLHALGKPVRVLGEDPVPAMFRYMLEGLPETEPQPGWLVTAVDVADEHLLGPSLAARYGGRVDLCVDHHSTNTGFAAETVLDPDAAAAAERIGELVDTLGVPLNRTIAACLYAGISTDTGCFRYSSTTAATHRYAARYMDLGVPAAALNRAFFETKTRTYAALERLALDTLRFYCGERVAVLYVTQEMFRRSGSNEEEYVKIAPLTRQIEGVLVGVALRERTDGTFKISLRSHEPIDAAAICARMGGGGHARAAGCASEAGLEASIAAIVRYTEEALAAHG